MDSVRSVSTSPERVKPSQPSVTKIGWELQDKSDKPASDTEKVTNLETNTSPKTPPENSIDVTA